MKFTTAFAAILFYAFAAMAGEKTSVVLKQMYKRYHGKWHKSLRFIQETERYRNDSLISTDTWYETMVYPRMFRIDFAVPDSGNCVIFRNDSAYIFKAHTLVKSRVDSNDLLFMLGGMYFADSYDAVAARFTAMKYDVSKSHITRLDGRDVYVIGADDERDEVNQLWVDKEFLRVVKFVKYEGDRKEEGYFEGHKNTGKGWCETLVSFYVDGRLLQKERYHHIVTGESYDPVLFSPHTPWQYHWYGKR